MAPDEDRGAVENREAAGIARFQEAKSGNFRETFWRATDENGEMAPDEDSEAVEISRGSRNREISGGVVGKLSGGR